MKEEQTFVTKFEEAMDDDFNTADALAAIFELVKFANIKCNRKISSAEFASCHAVHYNGKTLCDVLGLNVEKKEEILDEEIENLIAGTSGSKKEQEISQEQMRSED